MLGNNVFENESQKILEHKGDQVVKFRTQFPSPRYPFPSSRHYISQVHGYFYFTGYLLYCISWMHFLCCTIKGLGTMGYNRALGD